MVSSTRPQRPRPDTADDFERWDNFERLRPDQYSVILPPPVEQLAERLVYIDVLEERWEASFEKLTKRNQQLWVPLNDLQRAALLRSRWISLVRAVTENDSRTNDLLAGAILVPHLLKLWWSSPSSAGEGGEDPVFGGLKRTPHLQRLNLGSESLQQAASFQPSDMISHRIIPLVLNQDNTHNNSLIAWCLTTYGWVFLYPGKHLKGGFHYLEQADTAKELFAATTVLEEQKPLTDDTAWNMVAVDPKLHSWWEQGFCAFRCLGAESIDDRKQGSGGLMRISLEFHWMPVVEREAVGETLGSVERLGRIMGKTYGDVVGSSLVSGEVYHVDVESQYVKKMVLAYSIQWSVIVMTALAGGPRAFDILPDRPPEYFLNNGRFKGAKREMPFIELGPFNLDE
ncbi:hypothetical protein B0T21DRAFT_351312 [Apiosordaria backusii]|uniref:Uncharacterized protein n=1 Tax=Apiosordaria backusii TaxID=314023 RepID=A0AA40ASU3_9PEZI|nr:hypothetical protein B0T21DRAFT_351312 [Apiosordaria backusii]